MEKKVIIFSKDNYNRTLIHILSKKITCNIGLPARLMKTPHSDLWWNKQNQK
jgi:hypothetical protein